MAHQCWERFFNAALRVRVIVRARATGEPRLTPAVSLPSEYWPLFLLFFYILSPIPYCISRRVVDDTDSASNACKELAIFLTTGIVVSAFGLPVIFARASVVSAAS